MTFLDGFVLGTQFGALIMLLVFICLAVLKSREEAKQ